jgi:GH24 family phage-related lysozyme (muramidase)
MTSKYYEALASNFAQALTEYPSLDTPCRQNAVIEICFNLWSRWLPFSNTRACIRRQDWQGAHDGLLDSKWAGQVGKTRSTRLANYLLSGAYP